MSYKTNHITDKFKNTKIRVPMAGLGSTDFQKAMFALGFKWQSDGKGEVRRVREYGHIHALYVDEDCRITYSVLPGTFGKSEKREITPLELFEAAKQVKSIRKANRRLSRKRKAAARVAKEAVTLAAMTEAIVSQDGWAEVQHVDKEGFIRWDGDGHKPSNDDWLEGGKHGPLTKGMRVDLKYRNGHRETNLEVGSDTRASGWFWVNEGSSWDIVAYRLCPTVRFNADGSATDLATGITHHSEPEPEVVPDTNPKKQYGLASIPLNLWSPLASAYGAVSLYNGSLKYGRGNYKATPVEASIYIAAALRHLLAWAEGEEFDPADGCPNLGGVLANIAILLDARAGGTLIDDRQLPSGYLQEREMLKALVVKLQETHAGKDPRHYTIADKKA